MLRILEFFGFTILTRKQLSKIEKDAQNKAVSDLVSILRKGDRIFLEPVTLVGDNQTIMNSVFIGIPGDAITVIPGKRVSD